MPAGVFVSDLAQLAESDDDFQAAFAIAPEFFDVTVEAETVAVFDREFRAAKFKSAAAFASETVAVVVLAAKSDRAVANHFVAFRTDCSCF